MYINMCIYIYISIYLSISLSISLYTHIVYTHMPRSSRWGQGDRQGRQTGETERGDRQGRQTGETDRGDRQGRQTRETDGGDVAGFSWAAPPRQVGDDDGAAAAGPVVWLRPEAPPS